MILAAGGTAQGKLRYILEKYSLSADDVSDFSLENSWDFSKRIFYNFDKYVRFCAENNENPLDILDRISDKIIITCETGCGLVPIEASERYIRELNGRVNCILAEKSENVIRICCGIGIFIK